MPHRTPTERIHSVMRRIDQNPAEKLTLKEMADSVYMSPFHFSRLFKAHTGMSPTRYLLTKRVEMAAGMIRWESEPIAGVAAACGFCSQSHMTQVFKKLGFGTPAAYRRGTIMCRQA